MRRIFSITMILALMSSWLLPNWAMACAKHEQTASCHRSEMRHGDMLHHHHEDVAPARAPSDSMANHSENCPMDCCIQGHPKNGAAITAIALLSPPVVTDQGFHFVPATFTRTGFSSHTDRGPPAG